MEKFIDYIELKNPEFTEILKDINNNFKIASQTSVDNIYKLYPKINEKFEILKYEGAEAQKAATNLDIEINILQEQIRSLTNERVEYIKKAEEDNSVLVERIVSLEKLVQKNIEKEEQNRYY